MFYCQIANVLFSQMSYDVPRDKVGKHCFTLPSSQGYCEDLVKTRLDGKALWKGFCPLQTLGEMPGGIILFCSFKTERLCAECYCLSWSKGSAKGSTLSAPLGSCLPMTLDGLGRRTGGRGTGME